jgi:hypothetical protein
MATPSRKSRNAAIARAKARLDERSYGNDLWQVVLQYSYCETSPEMADRATALVLGSILEQGLELAILSHCVLGWNTPEAEAQQKKLFGGGGEGSMNFSIKIRMAHALGVYGPRTRDDIDTMRHIRNFFAHDRGHLTFDDTDVSDLCDQIRWVEGYPWGGVVGAAPITPRNRYVQTVRHFYPYLTVGIGKPIRYATAIFPFREMYS